MCVSSRIILLLKYSKWLLFSQLAAKSYVEISPCGCKFIKFHPFLLCFKIVISSWVEDFFQNIPIYLW